MEPGVHVVYRHSEPDTRSWGPHTHTHMMAQVTHEARRASGCPWRRVFNRAWMRVGESLLRACVHILHAGWIHAFRMFMHVPKCESECLCDTYACLSHPAYDIYLSVGRQFHCRADVRASISPSCFHFQMGLDFARPYCSHNDILIMFASAATSMLSITAAQ